MSKLKVTLRVDFDSSHSIGPGKIALLEHLRDSGSLSQAARDLGMSYRRAWQLLSSLNQSFCEPLVLTAVGGSGGGGSTLTPMGARVIAAYRDFEHDMNTRAGEYFGTFAQAAMPVNAGTRRSVRRSAPR